MHAKRIFAAIAGLLLFFCGCTVKHMHPRSEKQSAQTDRELALFVRNVNQHSAGWDLLKHACDTIGHRLSGTPHGAAAEEYAYHLLEEAGLAVEFDSFPIQTWLRDSASVTINDKSYPCAALAFTPNSFDGRGELIDLGHGYKDDFTQMKRSLAGCFVLVSLGGKPNAEGPNPHRTEKMNFARAAGAAGVIFTNTTRGNILLTGTSSLDGKTQDLPATCVGCEDGEELRKRLKCGETLTATVSMRSRSVDTTARNVIATLPGTECPDEWIVLCGHLDSWDLATGAFDNGVGAFTIIDIGRALAASKFKPKRTIKLILFMGEEFGLIGSTHRANAWQQSGDLGCIRALINLDMVGNVSSCAAAGDKRMQPILATLAACLQNASPEFDEVVELGKPPVYSDHLPFMLEGVTVVNVRGRLSYDYAYAYYHSNADHIETVPRMDMVRNTRHVGALLWLLANYSGEFPPLKSDEEIRDYLDKGGLKQTLKNQNMWRWDD